MSCREKVISRNQYFIHFRCCQRFFSRRLEKVIRGEMRGNQVEVWSEEESSSEEDAEESEFEEDVD